MTPPEHAQATGTKAGIAYAMALHINGAGWESRDMTREDYLRALTEGLACRESGSGSVPYTGKAGK